MKKILLISILITIPLVTSFSQMTGGGGFTKPTPRTKKNTSSINALSLGVSLYHLSYFEYERLIKDNLGLTIGFIPVGAYVGGKYHLNNSTINSSSALVKIGYSNVLRTDFTSFQIGIGYEFRAKKLLAAGIDAGFHRYTYLGDEFDYFKEAPFSGIYININAGIYFPW